jgi:hypothetical protein
VAVIPAAAIPETTLSKCRRRKRKSSRTATALVDSSTTGAISVAPRVSASLGESTTTELASQSVAKPFARIATSVAAHAPHANANRWVRHGAGSVALSQRNAVTSSGTGKSASPKPTRRPCVPVCSRTSARIIRPHSASRMMSAAPRSVRWLRCHQEGVGCAGPVPYGPVPYCHAPGASGVPGVPGVTEEPGLP